MNGTFWNQNLVIDARPITAISGGFGLHVAIDACARFWFSIDYGGALIYDRDGVLMGQLPHQYTRCSQITITRNFTIYFSTAVNSQIFRLQPDLNC